jgi:hypothetical protein
VLPILAKERIEIELPQLTKSSTDTDEARLLMP